jgi:hypothetical protein
MKTHISEARCGAPGMVAGEEDAGPSTTVGMTIHFEADGGDAGPSTTVGMTNLVKAVGDDRFS